MSTSTGAFGLAAHNRKKSSRKVIPQHFLGGVAVAAVVLGCAWTVYSNVFGASIYPTINNAAFDAPVVRNSTVVAARPARPAFNEIFASLPQSAPKISAPETVSPSIMFNERFAASAPQGDTLHPSERQIPATQLAEASPVEAPKKADAAKLAEAPKAKDAATQPASTQVALNVPAPAAKPVDAKVDAKVDTKAPAKTGASVRDMAQRAKHAVMSIASNDKPTMVEKLWGKQPAHGGLLAYASADASVTGSIPDTLAQNPMLGGSPPYDKQTAVYDIAAKKVYLPDGTVLEAHSGLGAKMAVSYTHLTLPTNREV